ncbi:hypothetical protein NSZ01_21080 [Nocardioides szechwanensis]|uniref:WD40-like Beta Propeller Repeat n=1 Tax=Nocardioides szechwanensis TaxID=1005944 RepID=A0A1H0I0L2_9ACTN|nr:hypothetical protein [Nocardioides szechwanensis]GEP34340.1 hypothetical protein NSZ01_21080 [Nocardioides szechwanensis]SDO24631.1 hypothetical protein SAMN05192576_3630 [Nocardioides szechwanensis]
MTRTRRLAVGLGALLLTGGLTAVPPGSAVPAPEVSRETVVATSLAKGPRPAVAYLEGRSLHLPSGAVQTLPFPASHARELSLLGPSPRGWVVVDTTGLTAKLFRVRGGTATKFWSVGDHSAYSWRLGVNGRRVIQLYVDRSAISYAVVFDLDGRNKKSMRFNGYGSVLAFTGDRAVVSANKTWDWVVGSPKSAISPDASPAADIRKNILFVPATGDGYGPTTLGLPDAAEWSADFLPRQVSTAGSYVVGYSFDGKRIQVRDMVNGVLVRSIRTQHPYGAPLFWESDAKLMFVVATSRGRAVVRCGVSGPCKRATPWVPRGRRITVSFSQEYFGA